MWKNIVESGRPQITIWRMHISCWIPKTTNMHSEYVICFSNSTMVALMRLSVKLYVRCLSCLIISKSVRLVEKCSEYEMYAAIFPCNSCNKTHTKYMLPHHRNI